ncbi:MAG: RNA methyltransferase [Chloroflexi bacterium]|nr:RNA methyltransferase [Chloroflexota bacterium]
MITSHANPKIKLVRALARRKERYAAQQFVAEGVRLIEEAVNANIIPAFALYTAKIEGEPRTHALLERLRALTPDTLEVSDALMQEIASTETPQGIVAVLPFIELALPAHPQFILILDAVRDPGNVGAILRSARAAGVDAIFFAHGAADPYNDKVVRAAMGAHFYLPIRVRAWTEIKEMMEMMPRIYLADARGEIVYTRADWSRPVALIVGGEAEGAGDDAKTIATARVAIPMHGGAESLNAAMATTVLLFQAAHFTTR